MVRHMTMRDLNLQPFELPAPHFDFFYDYMDKAQLGVLTNNTSLISGNILGVQEEILTFCMLLLEKLAAISSMKQRFPSTQDVSISLSPSYECLIENASTSKINKW